MSHKKFDRGLKKYHSDLKRFTFLKTLIGLALWPPSKISFSGLVWIKKMTNYAEH